VSITIHTVTGRAGARLFAKAAHMARAGDASWTAPFSVETDKLFNTTGTPFNRANPHAFCVALRNGKPVGRIMLIEHKAHLQKYRDNTAHFGFLEAIDDRDVISAVMTHARNWARERGFTRLEGPYSASINHEIGLLLDGNGTPTTFKTNDAPPRYAHALEALGFEAIKDIVAVEADATASPYPQRVAARLAQWPERHRLTCKPFNPLAFKESVSITNAVYADAWSDNWHALTPSDEEAAFIAKLMLPWIKPAWLNTVCWDDKPIGIISMIPDLNEAAHGLNGSLMPFGWAKYVSRLHITGVKRARIALIGVSRLYRGTRIGSMAAAVMMAQALSQARQSGVEKVEISWMLSDNTGVLNLTRSLPALPTRRWRIYGRPVD
jgi:GNAT superfamily N-acetyltransferase